MIIVICAIALFLIIAIGIYIVIKLYNPSQKFEGTGPAVSRDNPPGPEPTQPSINGGNGSSAPTPTTRSNPTPPTQKTPLLTPTPQPPLSINSGGNLFDGMEDTFFDIDFDDVVDLQKKEN